MTPTIGYGNLQYGESEYGGGISYNSKDPILSPVFEDDSWVWYSDWFTENKITGREDELNMLIHFDEDEEVVSSPIGNIEVEYTKNTASSIVDISDTITITKEETLYGVTGVPVENGGLYRLRLSNYDEQNIIEKMNVAFTH